MGTQTCGSGQGTAKFLRVRTHKNSQMSRAWVGPHVASYRKTFEYLENFIRSPCYEYATICIFICPISDLQVRDHSGCSALHYAVNINSPLKEEILHMMVEALRDTGIHTHTHTKPGLNMYSIYKITSSIGGICSSQSHWKNTIQTA